MWDLPGPGLEPVSPALAGGFLTTVPPGRSSCLHLNTPLEELKIWSSMMILGKPKIPAPEKPFFLKYCWRSWRYTMTYMNINAKIKFKLELKAVTGNIMYTSPEGSIISSLIPCNLFHWNGSHWVTWVLLSLPTLQGSLVFFPSTLIVPINFWCE